VRRPGRVRALRSNATLVCLPATAELINREGTRVRFPVKGQGTVEIRSQDLPGSHRNTP